MQLCKFSFLVTFVDLYDSDFNLELKYYPRRDLLLFSREVLRNLRKNLSTQVISSQVKGLAIVLTLITTTEPFSFYG